MAAFEGWARVELMGHRVRDAKVSEVTIAGVQMLRLDIPTEPPRLEFYAGSALYGITPTSEEECRERNKPYEYRRALAELVDDAEPPDEGEADELDDECGNCGEPIIGDEATERVAIDDGSDYSIWHRRCAEKHAEALDAEPAL